MSDLLTPKPDATARRGIGGHHSAAAKTEEWLTPPEIIKALGPFDLDPCSPIERPWDTAANHFTVLDDGLRQSWNGTVWCNPPYGIQAAAWLRRIASHGNGIALIFARTETAMFFESVWNAAQGVLFLEGRLHFHYPDGSRARANAGGPSVLAAYGDECDRRLRRCGLAGQYIHLRFEANP